MIVEEVLSLWETDAKIDRTRLGDESISVEQLHAKWWRLRVRARRDARQAEADHKLLRHKKFRFFTEGPTSNTQVASMPARGRILKKDAWEYVDVDREVVASAMACAGAKDAEEAVDDVLRMIAARGYRIDGAIKAWAFEHGR